MRFVSVEDLNPGMVLGRPFIGKSGELMLAANTVLSESLVKVIQNLRYSGLYIRDDFSEGVEPNDLISLELRINSVAAIRRFMLDMQSPGDSRITRGMENIKGLVDMIVGEISSVDGAMVNLIDLKSFDLYTFQHSVNVCVLSCAMGSALRFSKTKLYTLAMAAILHDIGKVFIPLPILNKPGLLNKQEQEIMKKHAADGSEYVQRKFHFNNTICLPIKQHHERFDGSGYPMQLSEGDIDLFARIISVADVYDAIMSKRPYHDAAMPSEAYEYVMGNAGGHFCPEVVETFVKTVLPFPSGITVRLSNGLTGLVYKNNVNFPMRPLIKIREQLGIPEHFLDLGNDPSALDITIQSFA